MKVTYCNDVLTFDITRAFLNPGVDDPQQQTPSSDFIVIPGDPLVRSKCFQVPFLPGTTTNVIVEDDLGNTKYFEDGSTAVLRRAAPRRDLAPMMYELVAPMDESGYDASAEVGLQLIVERTVKPHHRVLEIGGDDNGAVPSAILAKSTTTTTTTMPLLCFRSDEETAVKIREVIMKEKSVVVNVEGAILSSVPLVKNVDMLKEPAPGIDDDETWKPVRTMDLTQLAQMHPGYDHPDVLILGCNHDKYCPLILDRPINDIILSNADLKVIIIKNDFVPPTNDMHVMRNILRDHGFEITLTVGACDATMASYMPCMYEAWERTV